MTSNKKLIIVSPGHNPHSPGNLISRKNGQVHEYVANRLVAKSLTPLIDSIGNFKAKTPYEIEGLDLDNARLEPKEIRNIITKNSASYVLSIHFGDTLAIRYNQNIRDADIMCETLVKEMDGDIKHINKYPLPIFNTVSFTSLREKLDLLFINNVKDVKDGNGIIHARNIINGLNDHAKAAIEVYARSDRSSLNLGESIANRIDGFKMSGYIDSETSTRLIEKTMSFAEEALHGSLLFAVKEKTSEKYVFVPGLRVEMPISWLDEGHEKVAQALAKGFNQIHMQQN
jgi:hypothetical protein